jgi:hypothetical protein
MEDDVWSPTLPAMAEITSINMIKILTEAAVSLMSQPKRSPYQWYCNQLWFEASTELLTVPK